MRKGMKVKFEDIMMGMFDIKIDNSDGFGFKGGDKEIIDKCDKCDGTGGMLVVKHTPLGDFEHTIICDKCNGSGRNVEKIKRDLE